MHLNDLPDDLPAPIDDGAADHLTGLQLPDITLQATNGQEVNIQQLTGLHVIYIYPRTGKPDVPLPNGWDEIPGARGCTPESCGFRDHHAELRALRANVFGLSSQDTNYQLEAKERLQLPFDILSDSKLSLKKAIDLPCFNLEGIDLYKRLTLVILDGFIVKVFYPVFPPDSHASNVLAWLEANPL